MIKVNTASLEENASGLQRIQRQLSDILYELSQVKRELTDKHSVFEEEILTMQKQMERIDEEKKNFQVMAQRLQMFAAQYKQTEQKIKGLEAEVTFVRSDQNIVPSDITVGGRTDLTPTHMYQRNQPDHRNGFRQIWMSQWLLSDLLKKHRRGTLQLVMIKAPVLRKSCITMELNHTVVNQCIRQLIVTLVR